MKGKFMKKVYQFWFKPEIGNNEIERLLFLAAVTTENIVGGAEMRLDI